MSYPRLLWLNYSHNILGVHRIGLENFFDAHEFKHSAQRWKNVQPLPPNVQPPAPKDHGRVSLGALSSRTMLTDQPKNITRNEFMEMLQHEDPIRAERFLADEKRMQEEKKRKERDDTPKTPKPWNFDLTSACKPPLKKKANPTPQPPRGGYGNGYPSLHRSHPK